MNIITKCKKVSFFFILIILCSCSHTKQVADSRPNPKPENKSAVLLFHSIRSLADADYDQAFLYSIKSYEFYPSLFNYYSIVLLKEIRPKHNLPSSLSADADSFPTIDSSPYCINLQKFNFLKHKEAINLISKGKFTQANELYYELINNNQDDVFALYMTAILKIIQSDKQECLNYLAKIQKLVSDNDTTFIKASINLFKTYTY